MNKVEFRITKATEQSRELAVAVVLVDGVDLKLRVQEAEERFAAAEGNATLAGQYRGLWVNYVAPPSRHFLGTPSHPVYQVGQKTQILECECGEPGCWPLLCRISLTKERVLWSDFEQPHRNGESQNPLWDYSGFGPFEFEREAYEAALAQLAPRPDS